MERTWWRIPAFTAVASCFFVQGGFVWADVGSHPGSTETIPALAREGEDLFRAKDCQACHAVFGMGGFLGPDLTNAATRVPQGRFDALLQDGRGPMPAFHLDAHQREAVWAYLQAVDTTGQGTPPAPAGESGGLFVAAFDRWQAAGGEVPADVVAGEAVVVARGCGGCHRSFAAGGVSRAPDLSLAIPHLGEAGVRAMLADGRGAMPPQGLDVADTDGVIALLGWVAERRDTLAPARSPELTWWAYPSRSAADALASGTDAP